jgi:hypothetical protein
LLDGIVADIFEALVDRIEDFADVADGNRDGGAEIRLQDETVAAGVGIGWRSSSG